LIFKNQQYYNCEIELDTGETFRVSSNWIHNNNLDSWLGWSCDAGYKKLDIDKDFNIYSAVCKNDRLGNLFDRWHVLDAPTQCRKARCSECADDLSIGKRHIPGSNQ